MTAKRWAKLSCLATLVGMLNGCALTPQGGLAMVETQNAATTAAIIATLKQALGTPNITLGPREGDVSSTITVLPPRLGPYDTRSVALPEVFDVVVRQKTCFLVRRTTGVAYALTNAACVIAPRLDDLAGR